MYKLSGKKQLTSWMLIFMMLISLFSPFTSTTVRAEEVAKTFDLVEITDFHGALLDSSNTNYVGAALAKKIKDIKASNPDRTLVIGGGDLYQGTPVSNVLRGVPVRDMFNEIDMEVTALGNHEFDWGLDVIKETLKSAEYETVCANVYKKGTNETLFNPYKMITKDGVRIAVIGGITEETPSIVLPAYISDYEVRDAAVEMNKIAETIRENNQADVVLAAIHEGGTALPNVVSKLRGVDAVFGGHSHTIYDKVLKDADGKNTPTFIANASGKGYIDVKMTVNPDHTIGFSAEGTNYKSLTVNSSTPLDTNVKNITDQAKTEVGPLFDEKIGSTTATLTRTQAAQPYGESQLGNWTSDVIKNYANADVGMQNNGGIRIDVPAGDITVGTIFNLMPFDNTICTVNMTGAQLKKVFEQAVKTGGKGIQVSGVKFTYDSSKKSYVLPVMSATTPGAIVTPEVMGERVTKIVRESDGTEVKDTDLLKVAGPDFVLTGGDGFSAFVDYPEVKASFVNSYKLVRDAFIEDVRAKQGITATMNNRIVNNMSTTGSAIELPISEARTKTIGTNVTVTGTVTVISGSAKYIQDGNAGIVVYTTATVNKGDRVKVTGPLADYNGLLEIQPSSASNVQVLSSGNTVAPQIVTIGQINESFEGRFIRLENVTLKSIDTSAVSVLEDATGTIEIYRMPALSGIAEGDKVDVVAAVSQYQTKYQLAVGTAGDIVKYSASSGGGSGGTGTTTGASISIVATSDLHGSIYPYNYNTKAAADGGLAKVSTYVKQVRASNPNMMLIDNGDTIQGTPLAYYYDKIDTNSEYPMMKVMGYMGYDAWTLGNHEFNYGLGVLNRIIADGKKNNIHVLSANTYKTADSTNYVEPYYIKSFTINGETIKVGILGLTTKCIPNWENPGNYEGLKFNDLVEEAKKWVPIMKQQGADVIIASIHSGIKGATDVIPENQVDEVATKVSGIDAIVAGHTHTAIPQNTNYINPDGKAVIITQPKNTGSIISQIDIAVDQAGNVTGITSKNVSMNSSVAADPYITDTLAKPYQDATLAYTNTVLGQSTGEFTGAGQLTQPTAIMELINKIQKEAAGTQLSIAAPLSATAKIPQGNVTIQDISGVYVYENFLYGVKMTGRQLKDWLEYSARYYKQVSSPTDPIVKDDELKIADYNLDQLYGATYEIDLTQPGCTMDSATGRVASGSRIKNLKVNGALVKDTDVFTVAINNYRYNGGGGFMKAAGLAPGDASITVYDSMKTLGDDGQVRNMMFKYIQDHKTISPTNENNWRVSTTAVTQQVESSSSGHRSGDSSTTTTQQQPAPQSSQSKAEVSAIVEEVGGVAKASIDAKAAEKAIAEVKNNAKIEVSIGEVDASKPVKLELSADLVQKAQEKGVTIALVTKGTTVALPAAAIPAALAKNAESVSVEVVPTAGDKAKEATAAAMQGDKGFKALDKVFDFTVTVKEKGKTETTKVSKFEEPVTVKINLTKEDLQKANPDFAGVYYINGNKYEYMGGDFTADGVTFKTNHFSQYVVMEYRKDFADVTTAYGWAKEYIQKLAAKHVTTGIDENNFGPGQTVTRAQFATFIGRALGLQPAAYSAKFSDVSNNAYYTGYVLKAAELGIVKGDNGKFRPDDSISREEMAVMIMRAYLTFNKPAVTGASSVTFGDEKVISSWAVQSVKEAKALGIINGVGSNNFAPDEKANRAQVAKMIIELLNKK